MELLFVAQIEDYEYKLSQLGDETPAAEPPAEGGLAAIAQMLNAFMAGGGGADSFEVKQIIKEYLDVDKVKLSELDQSVIDEITKSKQDFICLNFANADMVGHTGVWDAVIKAVETVDKSVEKVVTAALENDYMVFLTADHGNADYEINADGTPNTAHTTNPVPLFLIDNNWKGKIKKGKLGDIAPTILKVMNITIPEEMTGFVLI